MFDPCLLPLTEIALAVSDHFDVDLRELGSDEWRTVADVVQAVRRLSSTRRTGDEVLTWLQDLFADGYNVSQSEVTWDANLFADLRLLDRFFDLPYPARLEDRIYAPT